MRKLYTYIFLLTLNLTLVIWSAAQTTELAGDQSSQLGATAGPGQLIISEFRVRGPNGANDEFIEIYNASGADHTVSALSGTGYGVAASNGVTRCSIPNGTVIPTRGHYLCVNSVGYSLASYPAGNGTTATGDATYATDIPDNAGIAIFNNNTGGGSYTLANRLDAVGSTSEANTLYKEGTGYPALTPFSIDYSFYRDTCGDSGSIATMALCIRDLPKDTNNNAVDFIFVDTNGTSAGAGQRLGAPGPENLSSPIRSGSMSVRSLDNCVSGRAAPNRVRDFTSDPPNNSTFGTLDIRRRITNNTGGNLTRLRFRIIDLTTFPAPSGIADLRPRTSTSVVVTIDQSPCGSGTSNVTVQGTTLEQPPSQPNGGGFNSSMSAGTITLATPLANGASINVRFLFGIQQTGKYKIGFNVEGLTGGTSFEVSGSTEAEPDPAPFDFDGDRVTDIGIFRPTAPGEWWISRSAYTNSIIATAFGASTDRITPADFTGDGRADIAFWRPSTGEWFVLRSNDFTYFAFPFGSVGDIPMPADFDGDEIGDAAVFRPSTGTWFIAQSTGGTRIAGWGTSGDRPAAADYDGDGKADLAIFRPGSGQWWINRSSNNSVFSVAFGTGTDKVVQGDYTGDGKADIALWRPSNGTWYVLRSENNSFYSFPFGVNGDLPAPGDYDGDGRFDATVMRNGTWFRLGSTSGTVISAFGVAGDRPVAGAFVQ